LENAIPVLGKDKQIYEKYKLESITDCRKRAMTEGPESRFGSADHLMLPKGLYSGGLVLIFSSLFLNFLF